MSTPRSLLATVWLCAALVGCGGKVELLRDISEMEANEALAVLLDADIAAEKQPGKDGMVSLSVEKSHFSLAIKILNAEGLPHERYAKMGDVFRKEGLISSPLEERARYLWALSQELQATVSQIDGVIKARVHVVLPEKASGADPAVPSSAAVFIKHKSGYNLEESTAQIKRLVSNSIPGLSADKVTVVMLPAMPRSDSLNAGAAELPVAASASSSPVPSMPISEFAGSLHLKPAWIWLGLGGLLLALSGLGLVVWRIWGRRPAAGGPASVSAAGSPGAGVQTASSPAGVRAGVAADDDGAA